MKPWFTIESISADTYVISEYAHWEQTHCYLLCGETRAVLIDTGLGVENIKAVVDQLTDLPILVLTTHVHWDHIGSHRSFSEIAVHEAERDWLEKQFPLPLSIVKQNLLRQPCIFPKAFDVERYRLFQGTPQIILHDKDTIDLGNRQLQVVYTPGHSPGHCCFYEPQRRTLYAGDLIYSGCLDAFYPSTDPVQFYQSVKTVQALSVDHVFPGHYRLDLDTAIIDRIADAFSDLAQDGLLRQGSGYFVFSDFQIRI